MIALTIKPNGLNTINACRRGPIINLAKESGLAGNRTWIWGFGGPYTIHCTTRPLSVSKKKLPSFSKMGNIAAKYLYRNGQQYYAEKFSYNHHPIRS